MRGPALTHSGPVQNTPPRVSFSQQLSVERVSTNIYYFNNTWTESRGLVMSNLWNPGINAQRLYGQAGLSGLVGAFGAAAQGTPAYADSLCGGL